MGTTRTNASTWLGWPGPRNILRSTIAQQAAGFAGGNLLANGLAVISTAIATRNLATAEFGSYAFATSLLLLVALFFDFGLFQPAARLAAVADRSERGTIMGSALAVYLPVGAAYSATIFVVSFWVDSWFHVEAGHALRVAAPLAMGIPFGFVLQQLAQGVDRLHVSAAATAVGQLLIVILFAVQVGFIGGLSPASGLSLRCVALLVAGLACALWLRPVFSKTTGWAREFVRDARSWGFQLYLGRVMSIGTYNMDVLMLGIWATSPSVGLYVLAGSIATVSGLPVAGMAAALFGRMAREDTIGRRWLVRSALIGGASALAAWLLAEPAIRLFFTARYVGAAALVLPLALAQFVRGVTTMFNTFLSAHGRGAQLRNAGLVLTVSNVAFNFALIPTYGARGAAWASLLALLANFAAHVVLYRRSYAFE